MPAITPFSLEYLIGGLQSFTIFFIILVTFNTQIISNPSLVTVNNLIQLLCLFSFSYPVGIILDNIAAHFLEPYNGNAHRENFVRLLSKSVEDQIKRAIEFQTTKRILRITLFNLIFAELGIIFLLLTHKLNLDSNTFILTIIIIIACLPTWWTYFFINRNYKKYLDEVK